MKFSRAIFVITAAACAVSVGAHGGAPDVGATRWVAQALMTSGQEGRGAASPLHEAKAAFEKDPSAETAGKLAEEFIGAEAIEDGLSYFTSPPSVPLSLEGEGETPAGEGVRSQALRHYRSAIDTVESIRSLLSESEQKSGFLGTKLGAYEELVALLLAVDGRWSTVDGQEIKKNSFRTIDNRLSTIDQNAEAFGVAERMKARSFLDEMGTAKYLRARPSLGTERPGLGEGTPEDLLKRKRLLEARIKWLREREK